MNKYPFVVTVYRKPTHNKPVVQQFNFEDIGLAHLKFGDFANDRSVVRVTMGVTLKEVTYHHRMPKEWTDFSVEGKGE